jgi:hypothetical protein
MATPANHVASNNKLTEIWQKVAAFAPAGTVLTNDTEVFVEEGLYNDPEVVMLETVGGCTRETRDGVFIIKLACAPADSENLNSNVTAAAKPKEWAARN